MTDYWKNISSVLTGSAVAQIIPILGALFIARLYAPSDFGIFSVWLGLVMLLGVLITLRYDQALAIEEDGLPRVLAVLATIIVALVVSSVSVVLLIIANLLAPTFLEQYPNILILAWVPAAFLLAVVTTWQSWAAAEGQYFKLSCMRIAQAALVTILQILAGVLVSTAESLVVAHLIGSLLALIYSVYLLPLKGLNQVSIKEEVEDFWRRRKRFPLFSLPADFINTAAGQLPVLIIAARFGADMGGFLALTMKVLGAPIGVLGRSVLDVFKRHAASGWRERGECREEYIHTFKVLGAASLIFVGGMFFICEQLFILAFGAQWEQSGTIAIWLLPLFALRFVASPLSYMVYIADKQHLDLFWQLSLLAMTLICLGLLPGHALALQGYSLGYSVLYLVYLGMSYRFSLGASN